MTAYSPFGVIRAAQKLTHAPITPFHADSFLVRLPVRKNFTDAGVRNRRRRLP